jgi:hypothetical protein
MKVIPLRTEHSPFSRMRSRAFVGKAAAWWVGLGCAVFGILTGLHLVIVPLLAAYSYWIVVGGLVLVLVATR